MTPAIEKHLQEMAEKHALSVEWKGEDYGARKRYYADAHLTGSRESAELWKLVGRIEAMVIIQRQFAMGSEPFRAAVIHRENAEAELAAMLKENA